LADPDHCSVKHIQNPPSALNSLLLQMLKGGLCTYRF
jgi:hypothetical protein